MTHGYVLGGVSESDALDATAKVAVSAMNGLIDHRICHDAGSYLPGACGPRKILLMSGKI
jgi:hypothetical protein